MVMKNVFKYMATVYFFDTPFVFSFLHDCRRAHCALIFLRPSFSRLLSTSRKLFLILVLNPVGTFDKKEAQEVGFVRFCMPILFLFGGSALICAHIFLQCARNIFIFILKPDIASRTSFLAARSSLLPLLFPLSNTRFSVLISLLAARCLVLSACCSLLAILCSQNL